MEIVKHEKSPLVSVVMANYNNARFLPESIESVLFQTYTNIEFFIVDDGSKDESIEIIERYQAKDSRIRFIRNGKNLGQSRARNKAIGMATGRYVAIVDSDDICLPERLEKQVLFMESNPEIGVLGTGFYVFTTDKNQCNPGHVQSDGLRNGKVWVHNPTCMIRRSIYDVFGYYNSKFDNAEDVELYFRWFSRGVKFHNLEERLLKYRVSHGNNVSDTRKRQQVWTAFKINILALFVYRIKFSLSGYFYTGELFFYWLYLFFGLDKVYKRDTDALSYNIKAHDRVSRRYEKEHVEIYNDIEQKRLKHSLGKALGEIRTGSAVFRCLDFGCGAGNITRYLLEYPDVVAVSADISDGFLNLVRNRYADAVATGRLDTISLNGRDLSNVPDHSFDLVSLYSVLHHIPDYLLTVQELIRVLKPGGVLFIDHETAPAVWKKNEDHTRYTILLSQAIRKKTTLQRMVHMVTPRYWFYFIKAQIDPRFKIEGDIHVFQDDHIEWSEVEDVFEKNGMEILSVEDYLLFNGHCPSELYAEYKDRINDTRLVVARKS